MRTMALKISRVSVILAAFIISVGLAINPMSAVASAGAVSVPVTGNLIGELLVALGLMSGNDTYGYDWRTDTTVGQQFYTTDIFGNVVPKIKNGDKLTDSDLSPLLGTVIPDDLYTYDGSNFAVSGKTVTASDIFLTAKSLASTSYFMPVNIRAVQTPTGIFSDGQIGTCAFSPSSVGTSDYYFAYAENDMGVYIRPVAFNMPFSNSSITVDFSRNSNDFGHMQTMSVSGLGEYIGITFTANDNYSFCNELPPASFIPCSHAFNEPWIYISGSEPSGSYFQGTIKNVSAFTCLVTDGVPSLSLNASVDNLANSIVQVKPSNDDDSNNGSSPPTPQSPQNWEIWKGIEDLITFISTGDDTNNGTTFDEFVNNNYNYVDVNINVPEETTNNINISGGLDINGNGNVDITIHEDVSIPVAGDGSGFYSPTAVDVIGALSNNNPVISTLSSLFSSIDPALVSIFSVSVSLLLVLGLWKLIRG